MAGKEATVYVVDQGSSMGECHNGRIETDLDYGMRYVWDKIAETMTANRTTLEVGVIGFRTDETDNELAPDDPDAYSNICIMKALGAMQISHLQYLQTRIKASDTDHGDAISAIVIAIQLIKERTTLKTGLPAKVARKIVLLTDGQGAPYDDEIDPIASKINEENIELVVVGVDFDDAELGFKEEDKSDVKARNESLLRDLTSKCSTSVYGNVSEAINMLSVPSVKAYRPYFPYKGKLTLGNPKKYPETTMSIDVERCFKTHVQKPVSATSFASSTPTLNRASGTQSSQTALGNNEVADGPSTGGDLSVVRSARTYKVNDASIPGGKRTVEREELAKGYEYGRTAVHLSESDENVTKLETTEGFEIVGFVPIDKYEKFLNVGESCITIAQKMNSKAAMALSSLIHALYELESYAVARIVLKDGKHPQMLLLAPLIEPDLEALIDVPLPFAEDVRVYRFPPLDKVITISGATVTKHRNIPGEGLVDAMSTYVDGMDLSKIGRDDEGQPSEYMPIEDTYSPLFHRINQAIRRRAVQPHEAITPPADILLRYSNPPSKLVSKTAPQLKDLATAADIKKVPPKVKGKRNRRDVPKPLSGLDVESLLGREKRRKLSMSNAIPKFKQMLESVGDLDEIPEIAKQMAEIVRELIKNSPGDQSYGQALEHLRVMREELIEYEEPAAYNNIIRDLKSKLLNRQLSGKLGSDGRDFWFEIMRAKRLGLIDNKTHPASEVSEKEAAEFYSLKTEAGLPSHVKNN